MARYASVAADCTIPLESSAGMLSSVVTGIRVTLVQNSNPRYARAHAIATTPNVRRVRDFIYKGSEPSLSCLPRKTSTTDDTDTTDGKVSPRSIWVLIRAISAIRGSFSPGHGPACCPDVPRQICLPNHSIIQYVSGRRASSPQRQATDQSTGRADRLRGTKEPVR